MMLSVQGIPAFTDNYIWLLMNFASHRCSVVDPGDAAPVLDWLEANPGWQLSDILITHHHSDHTGGILPLKQATGATVYGPADETIAARDIGLEGGENLTLHGYSFKVLAVPGHTLGHIAYYYQTLEHCGVFCGDTLFAGGCGRIFEGTPEQMFNSLQSLASLPETTRIYSAHEYTLSNLKFAQAAEPDNPIIAERLAKVERLRTEQQPTLPSTLALEQATNPFLRAHMTSIQQRMNQPTALAAFTALRAWKDNF